MPVWYRGHLGAMVFGCRAISADMSREKFGGRGWCSVGEQSRQRCPEIMRDEPEQPGLPHD
eukprot:1156446-Pelagomonas_calceolata.AAC.13